MTTLGTPFTSQAKKILLLGSGELGKEVVIECQRLGCEVIACDSYANAPAMQVADRSYQFSMLDAKALREVVEKEAPDLIVPEVEAIATAELVALEKEGFTVVPSANAVNLTMNREGIRTLAAETLGLPTSSYRFASTKAEFEAAIDAIGYPCFVKPIMSSSGKGQSRLTGPDDVDKAWQYAQEGGRAGAGKVIVEGNIAFDYEITLLTVRTRQGVKFCPPIGHIQKDGDYQYSWQPTAMTDKALSAAKDIADKITDALGGYGLFGVELFVCGDEVIFSEVSPRPHDTGMVTLISQNLSEFALHSRAILGLPIPNIDCYGPSASAVILGFGEGNCINFSNLDAALSTPITDLRLFGKPTINGKRRLGVALARAESTDAAVETAQKVAGLVNIDISQQ
ncbi:formate-dependent phosphoribosylglycinamide formyltransferase [Alteromonas lipolytica]|uniref:Formate-dependent phosphoribosylglycinamide formyltransferase n=1 Tax=Alteromonas lipolytica TaxID=1856405 RepID=A0A1E8F9X0_9ALTE|nr:formate-dependent phosphoribosylglycinamide formyltransferase [Alteromonas lipolytica]OFI32333.1 phosphoribosylglycinamide formyltransferase 2 [Alteromonas lipolytica]GGF85366.1 phosphoribosylglycinamide formyltransferase 2 [Alteromonas lipolytica]